MEFVTGGGLRIDYTITHEGKANIRQPGGNCVYAAVGAKLWDEPVGIWARKGENYKDEWLEKLNQARHPHRRHHAHPRQPRPPHLLRLHPMTAAATT